MPLRPSVVDGTRTITLDLGRGRLDLEADKTVRSDLAYRVLRNARLEDGVLRRRDGMRKIHTYSDPTGSWTGGSTANYLKADHAGGRLVPLGGFCLRMSFKAERPGGGNTAYVFDSRVAGQTYATYAITLSDAGVITASWTDSANTTHSIASTAVSNDAVVHLALIYDAVEGTTRLYINGDEDGTAETGLASTLQPHQGSQVWYFGVRSDGAGGIAANSHFAGEMDAFCLYTLRGLDINKARFGGTATWLGQLRRRTFQEEPWPLSSMVLACYDFNESSGTTLTDRSRVKNNGDMVGSPTSTNAVAYPAQLGNLVRTVQLADGKRVNVTARGGDLFYETIREGAA